MEHFTHFTSLQSSLLSVIEIKNLVFYVLKKDICAFWIFLSLQALRYSFFQVGANLSSAKQQQTSVNNVSLPYPAIGPLEPTSNYYTHPQTKPLAENRATNILPSLMSANKIKQTNHETKVKL